MPLSPLDKSLEVIVLPAFDDNYIFIVVHWPSKTATVVDPGDALPVLNYLTKHDLSLLQILITHHHKDHVGGIPLLKEIFPSVSISCSAYDGNRGRVPFADHYLNDGDKVFVGQQESVHVGIVIDVAAHTKGHIAYFFKNEPQIESTKDPIPPWLFVGDTLFGGGSGALFEGSPEMLLAALTKIRSLPDNTLAYCAHEYTEKNLWVARQINEINEPQKNHFEQVVEQRILNKYSVPLMLGTEKETNPFLRWDKPSLRRALNTTSDLETLTKVRAFRDKF